jgi:hypothetical protein
MTIGILKSIDATIGANGYYCDLYRPNRLIGYFVGAPETSASGYDHALRVEAHYHDARR